MKIIGFPHIVDNIGILRKKELQFMIISEKLGKKFGRKILEEILNTNTLL